MEQRSGADFRLFRRRSDREHTESHNPEKFRAAHEKSVERVLLQGVPNYSSGVRVVVATRKDATEFPAELSVASWETKKAVFLRQSSATSPNASVMKKPATDAL